MSRYYENFPQAPIAVVSRIAAVACVPSIIDAKACRDNSLILEVLVASGDDFSIGHILDIAETVGCPDSDVYLDQIVALPDSEDRIFVIVFLTTEFDFSAQFASRPVPGPIVTPPPTKDTFEYFLRQIERGEPVVYISPEQQEDEAFWALLSTLLGPPPTK